MRIYQLLSSTYIGAESYDYVNAVATDADGNVFVAGNTISKNFPTTKMPTARPSMEALPMVLSSGGASKMRFLHFSGVRL